MEKKNILRNAVAAVLAVFGLLTLFLSSSVIFDLFEAFSKPKRLGQWFSG